MFFGVNASGACDEIRELGTISGENQRQWSVCQTPENGAKVPDFARFQ